MATAYRQPEDKDEIDEGRLLEAARGIVGRLNALAQEQVSRRLLIEQRWLEDLRAYFGYYPTDRLKEMRDAKRSEAFVKLTSAKTDAWAARLSDLLFPTDDKNWGIKPTPLPKLAAAAKESAAKAMQGVEAANQTADQGDPAKAEMIAAQADAFAQAARQSSAEIDEAKKRCDKMAEAIDDQLVEANWVTNCRDAIEDGCRIGTGVIKGPLTSNRLRQEWRPAETGEWALAEIPDPQPEFIRVDPWHFFPDMSARRIEEAEFTFERSLPTRKDLRRFAMKLGFNKEAVRRLINEGPMSLNQADVSHIAELGAINGEGGQIKDRYVMWEYHGPLECDEIAMLLRAAGHREAAERFEEEKDPLKDYRVILHFCNSEVLRIAEEWPLDSGEGLYSVWNFSKGETSVFGRGVPRMMMDSQNAINGAWRMMMDNSGLSVGPQVVIDKTSVTPQDGTFDLRPLKVWLKTGTALSTPQNPPFQVYNIPNNQQQLAGIIELGKQFVDEETSMPLIAQGEAGATVQPVGTTSMLFNSANVVFRRIVKAWDDDMTAPTIRRAYHWNMQFNPDEGVKGDMKVDARGTSVLLVREIQSQNLLMIMNQWTVHPVIGPYLKVREGLVKTVQTMMIPPDDLLFDQEEADRNAQKLAEMAAQNQEQPQGDPMQMRLQVAQIDADSRLKVAEMNRDTAMAELALREKVSLADIQAKFGIKKEEIGSKERQHAANIAVEERRAATARAGGQPETEATGTGVG